MTKVWNERSIWTEDQVVRVKPNQTQDGVVLQINEEADKNFECRLYLTYEEAKLLAKQINDFVSDNSEE
ncbi:hypothetical protein [Lentimicrobium sp. S6]|uniref:hypothetical protein n=1 Tax=Lentimicrobium sp. S6 TaxID=2735872 RepID=UPI0015550509|nr:hypothetical protein [Lentimicrobium sp. S6]NPD45880.1 hypothetical protein [Lentimicrobium sp. S6]